MKKEKKKKREKRARGAEEAEKQSRPKAGAAQDPLQYAISLVGGKWKLRILWALRRGELIRYREIRLRIPGITDMMLSQSLRELAAEGFVERRQYQEIPPKVEYCITQDGTGLLPALEMLAAWAEKRMKG